MNNDATGAAKEDCDDPRIFYNTFKWCKCKVRVHDEYDINDEHYVICNNMYKTDTEKHVGNCGCVYDKDEKKCKFVMDEWVIIDPDNYRSCNSGFYWMYLMCCCCCCCGC